MRLKVQKRLASSILKRSKKKVGLDTSRLEEIKEAITRFDVKSLIKNGAIKIRPVKGQSKVRSRKLKEQRKKGRRRNAGSRKGKATARLPRKQQWMDSVRSQRKFIRELRDNNKIDQSTYRMLYRKSKGGYFRSKRHIKLYMEEHDLVNK